VQTVGDLAIDTRTRAVTLAGHPVALTPKEYDLLGCLAADPGAVRSREQLIHDVWDENWWGSTKTLDVHIASLRKKLRPELIETVRSVGYRLVELAAHRMTRRLLLSYLTVAVVVLVLLEVPLGIFYAQRERERVTAGLEHDASVLASIYEDALEAGSDAGSHPRRGVRAAHGGPGGGHRRGRRLAGRHGRRRSPRLLHQTGDHPRRSAVAGPPARGARRPWAPTSSTSRCRSRPGARCTGACGSRSTWPT
jgi:hypothetical protein